ncbi:DUF4260 domain-containing protein [Brevundimonas sp. SH203]|uniref:DUF4260 domain-containing protein n=1 Tax=Brevundimonas sp. SH203 TaxID=345167 RepID=UPI000B35DEC8|nr:DUF4260 domain-containing protein [Brevundimonas sp. SH203]
MRTWLRLEGLAILVLCVGLYARMGAAWPVFALGFLAPDLSFAAWLFGPRIGARAYNLAHSEIGPVALGLIGLWAAPTLTPLALIWGAHVGFDRMLGYGLKIGASFERTHLGPIGRRGIGKAVAGV